MKQNLIFFRSVVKILPVAALLLAGLTTSCSEGADCDEVFNCSVHDTQLESPELSFASKMTTSGSEVVQVSWPVVHGAGGYKVSVQNVDDPSSPVVVITDSIVDGTSFTFPKKEDTNYSVSVLTLGNEQLHNAEATDPTVAAYSTMVPGQIIPAGANITEFVKDHMLDVDTEQAFELEAGATYTLNEEVDFGLKQITFRGNKINRPIVEVGTNGVIRTSAGLKVKWINFDCTASKQNGLIECSKTQYPEAMSNNYPESMKPDVCYYVKDPILVQECMIKNLHRCLFYTGSNAYSIEDARVDNCIIQLDNDGNNMGDAAVFCSYTQSGYFNGTATQKWNTSVIRNVTMKNTTIYNTKINNKNRMVRFNQKSFGNIFLSSVGSATFENNTIIRVMSDKEFGNNTPNDKSYTINFNGNILCDVFRLAKFVQGNCTKNIDPKTNSDCWMKKSYSEDPSVSADLPFVTREDDLMFATDPMAGLPELDLTKPNGGVDFTVTSGTVAKGVGDPRWRE